MKTQQTEQQQLTKQEQETAKNLKYGLAIFLLLAIFGAALDLFTNV